MSVTRKSPRPAAPAEPPPKARRRARNLSLTDEAVARGEAYARARGTSLSAVVDRLLQALPPEEMPSDDELPPVLRRLRAMLATYEGQPRDWRNEYREHLYRKYMAEPEP